MIFVAGGERVAFQGEPGAYSEMATIQYFRNSNPVPLKSLQDVFDGLCHGDVDFGVVPIENSIEGSVNETYDLLLDTHFVVSGEIYRGSDIALSSIRVEVRILGLYTHIHKHLPSAGVIYKKGN